MGLPGNVRLKDGRWAVVRRAEPNDAEAWVANVSRVASERVYLMTEVFRRSVEEVRIQFAGADPTQDLWLIAEVDGRIVGGADFHRGSQSKNAHVAALGIALVREYRGLGLGEGVIRAGLAWARELGIRRVRLSVFATNGPALSLYRKLGFVEEGRLRGEVILEGAPVDEVLMALSLDP
ncbi:MAG TPA: GNAT family protein [Thermoplasmata archaeon]|nr:GNAT family protein [Thermoplasmata archaeon]